MSDPSDEVRRRSSGLNDDQSRAVDSILGGWEDDTGTFVLPMVDGPPGTGKTFVGILGGSRHVLEDRDPQLCYLAYTHYAADRALEGFIEFGFTSEDVLRVVDRGRVARYPENPFYIGFDSLDELTPNDQRRLRNTPILIGTMHGGARRILRHAHRHPLIVIDEFSQVSPSMFFAMYALTVKRNPSGYVLLGDPNQLPVITTQSVLRSNIGVYIMARRGVHPHRLRIQYRMNGSICNAVNALRAALNASHLESHESVVDRTLTSLGFDWNSEICPSGLRSILDPQNPLILVNTDALQGMEQTGFTGSKYYIQEAKLAARLANHFSVSYTSEAGRLTPVVLSPYAAQVGNITDSLGELEGEASSSTVYKAQGREYPCVIISFTRKNPQGEIGFLGDLEMHAQTYVACSRGMAKVVILLSEETFKGHRDFEFLLSECQKSGIVVEARDEWVE